MSRSGHGRLRSPSIPPRPDAAQPESADEVGAPFAEPPSHPTSWAFRAGELPALRQCVARRAEIAGFSTHVIQDLVLAVNEVATDSVVDRGGGILRVWSQGEALVCEVSDGGVIDEPRSRSGVNQADRGGLWLANQLCDLVQVRSSGGGSVVRMHKRCG